MEQTEPTPIQPEIEISTLTTPPGAKTRANKLNFGILSVLGAVVLWSSSYVVTKAGVGDIPPLTFAAIRFVFASVFMILLALTMIKPQRVEAADRVRLAIGGLLGITAYFALQNLGVQRTSAADATLLVAAFPVISLVLEVLLGRSKVHFKQAAGIAIAIAGICIVIDLRGAQSAPDRMLGDLFLLGTGLAWAFYNIVTQNVVKKYSTFTVILWQTLCGTAALLPLSLFEIGSWQAIPITGLLGSLYLGIFCSVCAFLLYGNGLKSLRPDQAVNLLNLVPVFGLVFAGLALREAIGWAQILGGVVVIGGVMLSLSSSNPPESN